MVWDIFGKRENDDLLHNSESYITDPQMIGCAEQLKKILSLQKPYSFINKLEAIAEQLSASILTLLEKDAERIAPEISADRKLALDSIPVDRPYAEILKKRFESRFQALSNKLEKTNELAALNGIPTESGAILQNCLNDIQAEEAAYQATLQQTEPVDGGKPVVDVPPVKKIQTVPMTLRTLTKGRTYTIRIEEDVNKFLREMKAELLSKIGEDTIIKLS